MRQLVPLRVAWLGLALLAGQTACAPIAADAVEPRLPPEFELSSARLEEAEPDYDALFDADLLDELDIGVEEIEPNDPFEPANRALLSFNQSLAQHVFDPMIRGYRFVLPDPVERAVRRFFENSMFPVRFVNNLLQTQPVSAVEELARFAINTTIGVAGLFDPATHLGIDDTREDFGQTLGVWGVPAGPYLVLPVFGPNTFRDVIGNLVDLSLQPLVYLIGPAQNLVISASRGFSTLEAHDAALKALEESSVDFYAALRSAYLQDRAAQIETSSR